MKIKNILFDLDGTLTDPKIGITRSIQFALENLGLPIPHENDLLWCIGPSMADSMKKLLPPNYDVQVGINLYRERYGKVGLFENSIYPGIESSLEILSNAGLNLYVATAKPTVYAIPIIEHFKLERRFIKTYGSNLDGSLSNKSELLSLILKQEKLDPSETVMVGDRKFDVIAAKENGLLSVAVTWGYGSEEELLECEPHKTIHTSSQLDDLRSYALL